MILYVDFTKYLVRRFRKIFSFSQRFRTLYENGKTQVMILTPWIQDVNWTYIRHPEEYTDWQKVGPNEQQDQIKSRILLHFAHIVYVFSSSYSISGVNYFQNPNYIRKQSFESCEIEFSETKLADVLKQSFRCKFFIMVHVYNNFILVLVKVNVQLFFLCTHLPPSK